MSDSQSFAENFFSKTLSRNHDKIIQLADLKGKQIFFLETFGIGYILSIVCYGTYLVATGDLRTENLALSIYAIYAAMGIRSMNFGYTELKEKTGILNEMEDSIGIELTN